MTSYLILHGFGGSTGGHWQEWLAHELQGREKSVWFPQFTNWDHPDKTDWLAELKQTIAHIPEEEPLRVITHSLGCILWMHYAAQPNTRIAESVTLVSPPACDTKMQELRSFFPVPEGYDYLRKSARHSLLITATNDPYLPPEKWAQYAPYRVPIRILPDVGHINVSSHFGPWPWMLEHCLNMDTHLSSGKPISRGI